MRITEIEITEGYKIFKNDENNNNDIGFLIFVVIIFMILNIFLIIKLF